MKDDSISDLRGAPDADHAALRACLARIATGEEAALADLYQRTSGRLNALLLRMLRDRAAAEEVLQSVYLAVWRSSGTFDPARGSPVTWLVTVARNKAIDHLRAVRTRNATFEPLEGNEPLDQSPSVVETIERRQERAGLLACLDRLPSRQRAAIRAAFFEGLTYEALAQREGVPLGTLKSAIRRGLLRLRACLNGAAS